MATQDGAAEGFKMDPFTLQFCDPAYERDFIVSRASESLKPVWVLVWLLIVGLKLAHLIAASKWGQLHELHDDKGAVLASVACIVFWGLYQLEDKVKAHSIGSIISSLIFIVSFLQNMTSSRPDCTSGIENLSGLVTLTVLDLACLFSFALASHLLHLRPFHKLVLVVTNGMAHTLSQVSLCVGTEHEAQLAWVAVLTGCLVGYILESSLRIAYRAQDMESRRFAAMLKAFENTDSSQNSMARQQCKAVLSYAHALNEQMPEGARDIMTQLLTEAVEQLSVLLGVSKRDADALKLVEPPHSESNSAAPLVCVVLVSDPLWRSSILSFCTSLLHADMERSCALGASTAEVELFEDVVLGIRDRLMVPHKVELCAADIVSMDQVIFTDSEPILGSDLAGRLQVSGFCGITCLFTSESPDDIRELEGNPGVDLVVDRSRGVNFEELANQVIPLREARMSNDDHSKYA